MTTFLSTVFSLAGVALSSGSVVFHNEVPYFQAEDSPFFERIERGEGYLEDFEDGALNTPNIVSWDSPRFGSIQIGNTMRSFGNTFAFSVDADDGLNGDFMGFDGDAWRTTSTSQGGILGRMEFRFEPDTLGRLPIWVGFVVTQVQDQLDDFGYSVRTATGSESPDNFILPANWVPDSGTFLGDTRQHRFFGIELDRGIDRLIIGNISQIDHLQYGYAPIPEPGAAMLGLMGVFALMRRRREMSRR